MTDEQKTKEFEEARKKIADNLGSLAALVVTYKALDLQENADDAMKYFNSWLDLSVRQLKILRQKHETI